MTAEETLLWAALGLYSFVGIGLLVLSVFDPGLGFVVGVCLAVAWPVVGAGVIAYVLCRTTRIVLLRMRGPKCSSAA